MQRDKIVYDSNEIQQKFEQKTLVVFILSFCPNAFVEFIILMAEYFSNPPTNYSTDI